MVGGKGEWSPGELRRVLREHVGLDVMAVRAAGGESRCAFWVTDRVGAVSVLKIMPGAPPEVAGQLHALNATLARLRDRGYPAPRLTAIGQVPGLVFWIQPRLPGAVLDRGLPGPDCAALGQLLPGLLRLNDAQAGLGTGPRQWRNLITQTLVSGGDGYCLHSTLQASSEARDLLPVLRRIGERCGPAIGDGQDFVHYDFTRPTCCGTAPRSPVSSTSSPLSWPVTAPSTWRPCCSATTTASRSATCCAPGSWP